jgi:hypothetical protein
VYRSSGSSDTPLWLYLLAIPGIFIITLIAGGMTSQDKAVHAAEDLGFTNVKVISKDIWFVGFTGCDVKDNARFTVHGTGPDGKERDLTVCAGIFKGGTVRSR